MYAVHLDIHQKLLIALFLIYHITQNATTPTEPWGRRAATAMVVHRQGCSIPPWVECRKRMAQSPTIHPQANAVASEFHARATLCVRVPVCVCVFR